MCICVWKPVLATAAAAMLIGGVALGEPGSTAVIRQTVRLVNPQLSPPSNAYAQNAYYQAEAGESPFTEEAPMPPLPQDGSYDRPPAEPPILPVAQPEDPPGEEVDDAPVYQPQAAAPAPPQPWRLPQPRVLQAAGITMGGWLQQGITLNAQVPNDRLNGPIATNDRHAEWQMNQLWLYFVKQIDNGGYGWDLGGRLDMIYGSDYRFGLNWGLEDKINGVDQFYGLVIPQMYAEVAYNDLSVKLGHFAGLLSYEQVPAVANFFYSHSYAMYMTEPLLVTGLMADYKLTDQWSLLAGFHRGWMMWEDLNKDVDFMGGLKWASLDKSTSIGYTVSVGPQDPVAGDQNRFAHSLLIQRQLNEKWRYVLQQNLGHENNGDPRSNKDAEWYGINQYLFYTINDRLKLGSRIEWWQTDSNENRYEWTCGVNIRPHANVVFRPEVRYDWGNAVLVPNQHGGEITTFNIDAIVTF